MAYQAHKFRKIAAEAFTIEADFSSILGSGDTIDASAVAAEDNAGADATATVTDQATITEDAAATGIQIQVRAGTGAASPYKLTFTATTVDGATLVIVVYMFIVEE